MVVNYSSNISSQLAMFINYLVGAQCLSAGTKINLFLCSESIEWDQIFTRLESFILMGRRWSLWAWWSTPRGPVWHVLSKRITELWQNCKHHSIISWLEINEILCNLASMTNTSVLVMDFNSMNCKIMFTACLKLHASSIIFTHTEYMLSGQDVIGNF